MIEKLPAQSILARNPKTLRPKQCGEKQNVFAATLRRSHPQGRGARRSCGWV